jgi:phospholipid/cholesterol/gamma-HCH transport system permease protein
MQEGQDGKLMVLHRETGHDGTPRVVLSGSVTLTALAGRMQSLSAELAGYAADPALEWDLTEITQIDDAGAVLLWRAWGERRPPRLLLRPEQERLLDRVQTPPGPPPPPRDLLWLFYCGNI